MKKQAKWVFEQIGLLPVWRQAKESQFERRGNDLYFYDEKNETGVALGNMGDGWICLYEDFFEEGE